MLTTTTQKQLLKLDKRDDIELNLDSILASEYDRGLPNDIDPIH